MGTQLQKAYDDAEELRNALFNLFSANFSDGDSLEERKNSGDSYSALAIYEFITEFVVPLIHSREIERLHDHQEFKRAVLEARIEEQQHLIDSIEANKVHEFRKIKDESDLIGYVDHGYALLAKQIRRNAQVRIAELKAKLEAEL